MHQMLKNVLLVVLMTVLLPKLITYSSQYFSIFLKPQLPVLYARYDGVDISGRCQIVKARGLHHCEDIVKVNKDGRDDDDDSGYSPMLASCDNRYAYNTVLGVFNDLSWRGSLQLISPYKDTDGKVDATVMEMDIDDDTVLHPLGIDVSPESNSRVFVVNHAISGSTIEVFDIDYDLARAHHLMTISDPVISTPNSIAAIDDHSFYVSNDHHFSRRDTSLRGRILNWMETFLRLPLGAVYKVSWGGDSGVEVVPAAQHIPYANGLVAFDEYLAVASTSTNQVLLYNRDLHSQQLQYLRSVHLPFHVDNLSYDDSTGHIIASGHPHFPTLSRFVSSLGNSDKPQSWSVGIAVGKKQDDMEDTGEQGMVAQRRLLQGNRKDSIYSIIQSNGEFVNSITKLEKNGDALLGGGLYMSGILTCRI